MNRRTILRAIPLLLVPRIALGQTSFSGRILAASGPGCLVSSPYVGPGDIVPGATAFFGVRAYDNAYAATCGNAFDLRRSSDNATMTAKYLYTGDLDTATISGWAGADTIFISKAYDSSGNTRNASQTSNSLQPKLVLSGGRGGKPYILMGENLYLEAANFTPATGICTLATVGYRINFFDNALFICLNGTTHMKLAGSDIGDSNEWMLHGNSSILAPVSDNAWHIASGVINGASSVLSVDGSDTTGTTTGTTLGGALTFAAAFGSGPQPRCEESIAWDNVALTPTQRADLRTDQNTYYS